MATYPPALAATIDYVRTLADHLKTATADYMEEHDQEDPNADGWEAAEVGSSAVEFLRAYADLLEHQFNSR